MKSTKRLISMVLCLVMVFSLFLFTTVSALAKGDANGDGKVNVRDATLIQKYVASIVSINDINYKVCDMNLDGKVNVRDATAVQKIVAGMSIEDGSENKTELYIPVLLDAIAELPYEWEAGSGFLYDIDADGVDELVFMSMYKDRSGNVMHEIAYSVYDIKSGKLEAKVNRNRLFYAAGAPSARVGAVKYQGKTMLSVVVDNGGTGDGTRRSTTHTLYDCTNFTEKATATLTYIGGYNMTPQSCSINGKSCEYSQYENFVESIDEIVTAEYYIKNNNDGSKTLYELIGDIQISNGIKPTVTAWVSKSEAVQLANVVWKKYLNDDFYQYKISNKNSLIIDGVEYYFFVLEERYSSNYDWSPYKYLFVNSVTGGYSSTL